MTVDRRRPLLVNEGEFRTDEALREAAAALGYGVHTKVRMADALAIDRSGLSNEQFSYALRAHFDWIVTDLETTKPEFAVEFDGESHDDEQVRHRDRLKDGICDKLGLPVLRIDRSGFRPTIRRSVIWYLVESWSLWKGWCEAQDDGSIPLDEDFEPWMFIERIEDDHIIFRDMSGPCRRLVERLWEARLLRSAGATHASRSRHADDPEHAEGYAWVRTVEGPLIVGRARIRAYSFLPVFDFDLAEDLAHLDLAGKLARWTEDGDRSVLEEPETASLPDLNLCNGWSFGFMGESAPPNSA